MSFIRQPGRVTCVSLLGVVLSCIFVTSAVAQTSSLPSPWVARDIGSPALAGSASFNQGTFSVNAGGADVFGAADQFHFVYQQVSGDVDIIARVDAFTPADPWTKVGVMIRASLASSSAHGFALVSASNGVAFHRRSQTGGLTTGGSGPSVALPRWVRLVRTGAVLTAYSSANGTSWTVIASDTIALGTTAYVGLAVTSHNTGLLTSADLSQVTVVPLSLPSPQQTQDIGQPAVAGSTSFAQGTYTIKAAGADIWGTADQFRYVYQPITGDVDIAVRVGSITNVNAWSKAGVMIRESLSANSRQADVVLTPGHGSSFQRRIDVGGYSVRTSGGAGTAPGWVRLVRTGSTFEAFRSTDGVNWTSIGTDAIPMGSAAYVGIAVTSRNSGTAVTAVLSNLTITQGSAPPNQAPTASITSPAAGATFTAPATLTVSGAATDPDGTIARVEFYNGTTRIGSDITAPYSASWASVAAGTYSLTAVAFDNAGASTTSSPVIIQVTTGANRPPIVSLTAPGNGATYTAPATVTVSATASDPDGNLAKVEFYNGATLLGTDTTSPFSFSWTAAAGTYAVKAVAYDTANLSASSAVATITVVTPTTTPPTAIMFQKSTDDATLVTSYRLDVFASGANPNTATPMATANLAKPASAVNGDITVNEAALFSALAPGNYIATVSAVGAGGSTRSVQVAFTR